MTPSLQPLAQALTPRQNGLLPTIVLALGVCMALGAAAYGYLETTRTERVVVALRPVPAGRQVTADDLGTIEVPLHRPVQLSGIADPAAVIGRWAAYQIGENALIQPVMLLDQPPDQPVYPNGARLGQDMVALAFPTTTIGPLSDRDLVNIGYTDPAGDPSRCAGSLAVDPDAGGWQMTGPQPYACRLLQRVRVLWVDDARGVAYLEVTPYQSQAVWALQSAGVTLWGERYGVSSTVLPVLDRLEVGALQAEQLRGRE